MRKVHPKGIVVGQAAPACAAEDCLEHVKLSGDVCSPSKENIDDDAKRGTALLLFDEILDEFLESWFERDRSFKEANDEVVGKGVGVLGIGWETMVGAAEGDLNKVNGGFRRERVPELLDVERGVDKGNGVVRSLFYVEG